LKPSLRPDQTTSNLNARIEAAVPSLRRYAHALARDQITVDDLVQDCIVRALSKIHLWKDGTNLRAWLFTIMRHEYIDGVRRAVREGTPVLVHDSEPLLRRPAEQAKRLELLDLCRALSQLPADQRTAVLLAGMDGMTYKAVADIVGAPVGTIRARISRGRAALRRLTEVAEHGVRHL
jgi:RNA polymerase sigma-70 factor, ECF subfamily